MRSFTVWIGALAVACLLATGAPAQSFDRLVPDSTIFYLSIENLKRTSERFDESALAGLWNDPAMQAFLEKPLQQWSNWMKELKEEEGFNPEDLFDIVDGQMALALTHLDTTREDEDMFSPVLLADVGANADKLRELIAKVEEGRTQDFGRREEEFLGATIVHYLAAGEGDEQVDTPAAWFLAGGLFGMAADAEQLKRVLSMRGEGATGSLADLDSYRAIRARIGERPEVVLYAGVPAIMQALSQAEGGMPQPAQIASAVLGLENMGGLGMQMTIEGGGLAMKGYLAMRGAKEGLLKFFDAENSALSLPRWVPGDAVAAAALSIDWPAILEEVRKVANKIQPGAGAQVDAWFEMIKGATGIDVEKDFFGSFGKQLTFFNKLPEEGAEMGPGMPGMPSFLMAFSLADKEKFENALATLLMMAQANGITFEEQDYLGVKLRAIQAIPMVQPAIAVLPDQFLFAMNLEDLKDVIRRYGKDVAGLIDAEDYARAAERLPPARISVGFSRDAKAMRGDILKMVLQGSSMGGLGKFPVEFEMEKWPKVEVFERYIDVSTTSIVNEEGGIFYSYFLGFRPQEEEAEGE